MGRDSSTTGFMESFKEKLDDIRRIIDEDRYRKRVLILCQQEEPRSFEDYSSGGSFRKLERFESSTYSEVLKAIDLADNNKPVVMKIMRALSKGVIRKLPSAATKGCQSYNDILNELVITQALSQLHTGIMLNGQTDSLYRTSSFCYIHEIKVVSGNLERTLSRSKNAAAPSDTALPEQEVNEDDNAASSANKDNSEKVSNKNKNEDNSGKSTSNQQSEARKSPADTGTLTNNTVSEQFKPISETNQASDLNDHDNANPKKKPESAQDNMENKENKNENAEKNTSVPDDRKLEVQDEELKNLSEDDRMLMAALPHEYVVSVMRHDGQPLWYMMTHKKLTSQQLASVLVQVIIGLAIAEKVYQYEHRDLHVSNILIKRTSKDTIPFVLDGHHFNVVSHNIKATIIDATFSRLTHSKRVYYRDLTSTLRDYGTNKTPKQMSLQNRSYRQMVRITKNDWQDFRPKTNLIWLTYLCETLMKYDVMKKDTKTCAEIKKIRDFTLKVNNTLELLNCFPVDIS